MNSGAWVPYARFITTHTEQSAIPHNKDGAPLRDYPSFGEKPNG